MVVHVAVLLCLHELALHHRHHHHVLRNNSPGLATHTNSRIPPPFANEAGRLLQCRAFRSAWRSH